MKEKYFLIKYTAPYTKREDTLELSGKNQCVTINENWEYCPHIGIDYSSDITLLPTEPGEYVKVKRIIPEIFNSYYDSTIKEFKKSFFKNGEYYSQYSLKRCKLHCYTDSRQLIIDIDNDIDYFRCSISRHNGPKGRHTARKEMDTVPEEVMKQLFNLTVDLLHDLKNFKNLKDEYYKQLGLLIEKEEPVKGLTLNADIAFYEARVEIINRIKAIENRMINFDDTLENRNELRGELKGLKYCLKVLDGNR